MLNVVALFSQWWRQKDGETMMEVELAAYLVPSLPRQGTSQGVRCLQRQWLQPSPSARSERRGSLFDDRAKNRDRVSTSNLSPLPSSSQQPLRRWQYEGQRRTHQSQSISSLSSVRPSKGEQFGMSHSGAPMNFLHIFYLFVNARGLELLLRLLQQLASNGQLTF